MPLSQKSERILILESDTIFGEQLRKAIAADGYDVKLVTQGHDGLQNVVDTLPHLILLDIALTGANSYDIIEKKHAEPMLKKIPLFLLSTGMSPIHMNRIPEGSVTEFFSALHVQSSDIVAKIRQKLQKHE